MTLGATVAREGITAAAPKQPISMFLAVVIFVSLSLLLGVLIPDPDRRP